MPAELPADLARKELFVRTLLALRGYSLTARIRRVHSPQRGGERATEVSIIADGMASSTGRETTRRSRARLERVIDAKRNGCSARKMKLTGSGRERRCRLSTGVEAWLRLIRFVTRPPARDGDARRKSAGFLPHERRLSASRYLRAS